MSDDHSTESTNPYSVGNTTPAPRRPGDDGSLTAVDWIICILCSGIGCIVGIVRLIQGKPSGGKMIGVSILAAIVWSIIRVALTAAMQNQGR